MAKLNAFLTYAGPDDVLRLLDASEAERANACSFSTSEMAGVAEWMKVGTAEIVVKLAPRDELVPGVVADLRAKQRAIRAEAERAANAIEGTIQKLLAITMDPK